MFSQQYPDCRDGTRPPPRSPFALPISTLRPTGVPLAISLFLQHPLSCCFSLSDRLWKFEAMEGCQLQSEGSSKMVRRDPENADRVGNLSVQVLEMILPYLPIKDAVRTSILSKSWRHKWAKVSVLAFDAYCRSFSRNNNAFIKSRALVSIIDHVLSHHTGALEVFKVENLCARTDIDRWILNVSRRKSVKELMLHLIGSVRYKLPPSLYDCSSLIKLTLANCSLRPPSNSVRLQRLKCLDLVDVVFTEDAFANFISSCPSLENLAMVSFKVFANLHINAPNLRSIDISGGLRNITFGCIMVKLSEVTINYNPELPYEENDPESHSTGPSKFGEFGLDEFFINLPGIQRLKIASYFVKDLACGLMPVTVSMPFQLKDLYHTAISIDVRDTEYCLAALYLMNSSPNLTELQIDSKPWDTCFAFATKPDKWRDGCECCGKFEKLRSVEIVNVNGWRPELKVIEFLLGNSPVLEKMTIIPCQRLQMGSNFLEVMSSFKRASSNAEIIFDKQWAKRIPWLNSAPTGGYC